MPHSRMNITWRSLWLGGLILLVVLCAGCGGASPSASYASTSNNAAIPAAPARNADTASGGQAQVHSAANAKLATPGKQATTTNPVGQRYLVKSLNVSMQVKDTLSAADDLQSWISTTDPQAMSVGTNYQQVDDNHYRISLTFSVRATIYPQIYHYLRDYPAQKQGKLISFNESVQDVTSDYVDTNARLENLQTERDRILTLMKQAQSMSDVITIEQKLTDVEGQIESLQAQLNQLKDQVTFYNVAIDLQPIETYTAPPPASGWSLGQVFHDALAASISFGQGLLTFLVWLLAFSVYVIPILLILWFARKLRNRWRQPAPRPKGETSAPQAESAPRPPASVVGKIEENAP